MVMDYIFLDYFFYFELSPYSVGIDFRRQNLTSIDVRF